MKSQITFIILCLAFASAVIAADQPELFGIGAVLSSGGETTGPIIESIVPNSPADRARLSPGLIISGVAGRPTAGMSLEDCVKLIRGEPGSPVLIELTDPSDGKLKSVILFRARLDLGRAQE